MAALPEARFAFGENWKSFLSTVNEGRIASAERSLEEMLGRDTLAGRTFLDVGCGSGLFSLAARRLGARVHSFDDDRQSVECAEELRQRYRPSDGDWRIEHGSVLDTAYVAGLGTFDIVYSWGVLHHIGAMWQALDNVRTAVACGGRLFVAIYNDQGFQSVCWRAIKRAHNGLPPMLRTRYAIMIAIPFEAALAIRAFVTLEPSRYLRLWTEYSGRRGMSHWHDLIDWVGGYPFEVARPEAIVDFYRGTGFGPIQVRTCGGKLGCNEFVFVAADTGRSR